MLTTIKAREPQYFYQRISHRSPHPTPSLLKVTLSRSIFSRGPSFTPSSTFTFLLGGSEILTNAHDKWTTNPPEGLVILSGDFNQVKDQTIWEDFLTQNNLQLEESGAHTFQTSKIKSSLDGFLLPSELVEGCLQPKIYSYKPPTLKTSGHYILTLRWKAHAVVIKGPSKPSSDAFRANFKPSHQVFNTIQHFAQPHREESHLAQQ